MTRSIRSVSIKNYILNKIHRNESTINPICPVNRVYRAKQNKLAKIPAITMEYQIKSIKSIKIIRPYKTQKTIRIEPAEYSICQILKSSSYKKLQNSYVEMLSQFSNTKNKLSRQIKKIDKNIIQQTQKASELCDKLMQLDHDAEQLKQGYYQIKRNNYELRCQLDVRRGSHQDQLWRGRVIESPQAIDLDQMSYQQILRLEQTIGKQNIGLSSQMISKLTVMELSNIKRPNQNQQLSCCICCQDIQNSEKVIKLTCSHIHHAECIKQWLKIKRSCPLCKKQTQISKK